MLDESLAMELSHEQTSSHFSYFVIFGLTPWHVGFPGGSIKSLPVMQEPQETWVQSLGREDPLEEETVTHSSALAGKSHGQRATVHGIAKKWTGLKRLSTHAGRGI